MPKDKQEARTKQQDINNHNKIKPHASQMSQPEIENNNTKEITPWAINLALVSKKEKK